MKKILILKKGKTELNFGEVDGLFPIGFHDYDLKNNEDVTDIVTFLLEEITKDERKMMVLGAYSPSNLQDLELATAEMAYTLSRLEKNIHKRELMITIGGLISYDFKPIVLEIEETVPQDIIDEQNEQSKKTVNELKDNKESQLNNKRTTEVDI